MLMGIIPSQIEYLEIDSPKKTLEKGHETTQEIYMWLSCRKRSDFQERFRLELSVGDLPAYGGLGEGGFGGDLAAGGTSHVRECGLDVVAEGPDGDFLHGVAVGDGGFFEALVDSDWGEVVDAGDFAVAVTEAWSVASAGGGYGVGGD